MADAATPKRPRWRAWALDGLVLVAVLVGMHLFTTRKAIRGEAPALAGAGLDGAPLSLGALRGEPVLVQFWATWCPVCRQEEGAIAALAEKHRVITVAEDSGTAREIAAYLEKQGVRFPVLNDTGGQVARAYGVNGFPTSFIVDREGRVRFVEVGYTTAPGLRLRLWLAGL